MSSGQKLNVRSLQATRVKGGDNPPASGCIEQQTTIRTPNLNAETHVYPTQVIYGKHCPDETAKDKTGKHILKILVPIPHTHMAVPTGAQPRRTIPT